jgi:Rad3-related DNA helicase
MKTQIQNCDVAVIPYNYVIDSDLRSQTGIPFENSIIIFDEGHNIN